MMAVSAEPHPGSCRSAAGAEGGQSEDVTAEPGRTQFEAVDAATRTSAVAEQLRRAILDGALAPGSRLVESRLAEEMRVSRAPIREALRRLEDEGLVTRIPYRGTHVANLSQRRIRELYSLRALLEGFAVRRAIPRLTPMDEEQLEEINRRMLRAAEGEDLQGLVAADLALHRELCRLSDHEVLFHVWEGISNQIRQCISASAYRQDLQAVAGSHRPIMEAVQARDVARAEQTVREHVLEAGERLEAHFLEGQRAPDEGP